MHQFFFLFLALLEISTVQSSCPHSCSGHGECSSMNCECESDWDLVPDCSQMSCPYGDAWADKAYEENLGHTTAECSGRGRCNRKIGVCECTAGFTGAACQRLSCDKNCNGRGTCMTLFQASEYYSDSNYTSWDNDMTATCICDWGYSGPDCSLRLCPRGDDPLTVNQDFKTIVLTTSISGSGTNLDGTFKLTFMNEEITFEANAEEFTSDDCETFFQSFEAISTVTCNRSALDTSSNTAVYTISIEDWSTTARESNVFYHSGNPSMSLFECEMNEMTGTEPTGLCNITNSINTDLVEYDYCGNRGICDFDSGLCDCFPGFSGSACYHHEDYLTSADSNVMILYATSDEYEGNILTMMTDSSTSSDFSFLYLEANGEEVMEITGNGLLQLSKSGIHVVTGGVLIDDGGLVLDNEGLTIRSDGISVTGGVSIRSDGLLIESGGIDVDEGDVVVSDGTISVSSPSSISNPIMTVTLPAGFTSTGLLIDSHHFSSFLLFDTQLNTAHNESVLSVSNDPLTAISRGGLTVVGGVSISSGGLDVTAGGVNVTAGGLVVSGGGVSIVGGLVVSSGVTITSSGLYVTDGDVSIVSGDLTVSGTTTSTGKITASGGIDYSGSLTALSDFRMKTEIMDYRQENLLDLIMSLRPVKFKWKSSQLSEVGFIAQEVQQLIPDLVQTSDETDLLSIIQSRFMPIIVQAIQDMRREYDSKLQELEERIALLDGN